VTGKLTSQAVVSRAGVGASLEEGEGGGNGRQGQHSKGPHVVDSVHGINGDGVAEIQDEGESTRRLFI
jgi:hypothetical protein